MDLLGRHSCWLQPHLGTTAIEGRPPHAYMVALQHVATTLDDDPGWQRWWEASGVPLCELGIVAEGHPDLLRPSADIRTVPGAIRANFTCAAPEDADLLPLAAREVTGMFEVIRQVLGLGPLPPLPPLSEPPEQAAEIEVTCRPMPDEGALSQIQEFFGEPPGR
ncbi:hypothetical protein [Symbioplanes lichenis]|uniref:hypothetical protein n=1 Tax=Symbioplanes lichenis TaxID=1629072 RepID=UPI002738877C|nr:hypothetical protein [Actinoplanes lichenis]